MTSPEPTPTSRPDRQLDVEGLKALAHPLRVKILDELSIHGEFTASGLAERLGESSGATSYHLRQLEKHGFVREVEGKGTGRERWWEKMPGGVMLQVTAFDDSPATRAASHLVLRQWEENSARYLRNFVDNSETLDNDWMDSTAMNRANVRVTKEQLREIVVRWEELMEPFIDSYRGLNLPDSRPVQIHFNAFPLIEGPDLGPAIPAENEGEQP